MRVGRRVTTVSSMSDDTTPPQDPNQGATPPSPPPPPGGEVPPAAPPPSPPPPYEAAPPPPPPAYGAPPAAGGAYNAVDAIKYGWAKFAKSPSTLLVPTLLVAVAVIVLEAIGFVIMNATLLDTGDCTVTSTANGINLDDCGGPGFITRLFAYALVGLVVSMVASALSAGLIKSALNVADGKEVNAGDVISYATKPPVLTTAAILAVATAIGSFLCYLPGIVVSFLTVFSMFYVVDKQLAPVDAIKASISLVTSHIGETIVFYLLGIVVIIVGAILCGVGLLVAIPVVVAAAAYTFRILNNEPVTPAA
jgi:uncharacterized membrane protein